MTIGSTTANSVDDIQGKLTPVKKMVLAFSATAGSITPNASIAEPSTPQPFARAVRVVHTNTDAGNVFETNGDYARLTASVERLARMQVATDSLVRSLVDDIADLRPRMDARPTNFVDDYLPQYTLEALVAEIAQASETRNFGTLAELLDASADSEFKSPIIAEQAKSSLSSADAFTRAAAARALAVCEPEAALTALPSLIDTEANRTAKSIMKAALRSIA